MKFSEFEEILKQTIKNFREINKIGYIGFMGSLDTKRDLDLVIMPEKDIKKGEFIKALCNFLELLRKKFKKGKLIVIPYSYFEEEVEYLSKGKKEKDFFLHISSFPDFDLTTEKIIAAFRQSIKLYGKIENISHKKTDLDYYYNYLFIINCLYSNYPNKLETKKIHEKISYIFKHNNSKINLNNKTNKQIYFEGCDFLDSKI